MSENLADSSVRLALSMLQQLYQPDQNLVFSPYSLMAALMMLLEGTDGNSRAQLTKAFFESNAGIQIAKHMQQIIMANDRLLKLNANTIKVANFVYILKRVAT